MSIWSLTYQQSVFKRYHNDRHLSEFYAQDSYKNQLAYYIDMEQTDVTVTLCIAKPISNARTARCQGKHATHVTDFGQQ